MALQILIQGFVLSGLYALIAVGFTMIFSVGRVLNLAYGVYIMLGGYIYYAALQGAGLPVFASFILAILAGVTFGLLTYLLLVRRLEDNPIAVEISTLILAVVMQALIVVIFGAYQETPFLHIHLIRASEPPTARSPAAGDWRVVELDDDAGPVESGRRVVRYNALEGAAVVTTEVNRA